MSSTISRRHFLARGGAGALGAYTLVSSLGTATAQAALDGARAGAGPTVVVRFNEAALQAIRETHPGPPIVARALAIVHTCMYDAWAAYDKKAVGTQFRDAADKLHGRRVRDAATVQAVSFAGYRALVDLFPQPAQVAAFDRLMVSLGYDPSDTNVDITRPSGVGNAAAAAVLAFRHGDGSNQLGGYADTTGYQPVNSPDVIVDPNRWQPLRVSDGHGGTVVQRCIAPHWGGVTPFALTSAAQFRPQRGPAKVGDGVYERQAREIIDFTANLDDERKVIAEYWADGPFSELPPGHWCLFAQFVSARDRNSFDDDVVLFFTLTSAILDAGVACWEAKRFFDSERPVTAIHHLFADRDVPTWGGRTIPGRDWRPYQAITVVTPPFAEYVSGHSTFSAAGAEILRRFTRSDRFGASYTQPAGTSRVEAGTVPARDVTLSWATFSDAADQSGISRRFGGIHFEQGDLDGRAMGRLIGAQAWDRSRALLRGDG